MELFGASYPFTLGSENLNSLDKPGGSVKKGRWVNVNHGDWSNPNWKVVACEGRLIDRTTSNAKYTLFDTDVAVMTYDADPVLNMMIYDMVPAKSPLFDMNKRPPDDMEACYDWPIFEVNPIIERPYVPRPIELAPLNFMVVGLGAIVSAIILTGRKNRNDNL